MFMIGIDTYSWGKLIRLRRDKNWESIISEIIINIEWFITIEGKKEFEHFFPQELDILDHGIILPFLNIKLNEFVEKGFDLNDASLLEYNIERNYRIITEDRPMLTEGIISKRNIIFLIDFFLELTIDYNYLSKRELYHLIKIFRKMGNINIKKANEVENQRKKLSFN